MWTELVILCRAFVLILFLSGCSVYKNNGRKSFENKAEGSVKTQSAASTNANCWVQDARDPLLPAAFASDFSIQVIANHDILVCTEELQ